jgi:hypothetical protein
MKKLTELTISMYVDRDVIFILIITVRTIHLATNPAVGGSPPRLAMIIVNLQGDILCSLSELISLLSVFFRELTAKNTLIQYKMMNDKRVLILASEAAIIQPRLKIDDRDMITVILLSFICDMLPMKVLNTIPVKIRSLSININK